MTRRADRPPGRFDPRRTRLLLVYGGSFDPPHRAHVELPEQVGEQVGADGVLYVPAGRAPHKSDRSATDATHRLAMLRLALRDRPRTAVDARELDRDGPSYTVDTLKSLREDLGPAVELRLLIGADMAATFDTWHRAEEVFKRGQPLVMARPDQVPDLEQRDRWRDRIVPVEPMPCSSTEIRNALRERPDDPLLREQLDPQVLDYIREHGLYADETA